MQFKQSISILLTVSMIGAPALHAENSLYQVIKKEYLPGITLQAPVQKPAEDGKPPKVDLSIRNLTNEERQCLAFDLLADKDNSTDNGFIQRNTWEDLELFKNSNLLKTIKRTRTSFGEAVLGSMLLTGASSNPQKNQAVVRALVENPKLFEQVEESLKEFAEAEKVFMAYYLPADPAKDSYFKDLYFNGILSSRLFSNESTGSLNFFNHLDGAFNTTKAVTGADYKVLLPAAIIEGLVFGGLGHLVGPQMQNQLNYQFGGNNGVGMSIFKTVLATGTPLATLYWLACRYTGRQPNMPHVYNMLGIGGSPALIGIFSALEFWKWYSVSSEGKTALDKQKESLHYLQANLIPFATALHSVEKIEALIHQYADLAQAIPELKQFTKHAQEAAKLSKLVGLLKTGTFTGKASYFSNQGRVLVAHRLMQEHCKAFRSAFEAVGKMDAYMSAAKLFKDHRNLPVKYCFVTFRGKDHGPYLKLNNFWNPVLDVSAAVPNTVEFGAPGKHRNMILTGLNSAGKSTIIKGIVTSVLLAQIFGIAAAEEAEMTPFTVINTHIMIKDDVEHHRSLFQVEVDQAKDMLKRVRSLDSNEFALVIIDEMFRSTGPDHAQVHSYNFAKALSEFSNVITLESTHYKKLIGLEQETKGLFKNFKIEIQQRPDGTLYRPYKIEEGFTTSEITQAIFAEQGLHF